MDFIHTQYLYIFTGTKVSVVAYKDHNEMKKQSHA